MPNLSASLRDQDLGFISIIASFWRISIERTDVSAARQSLVDQMLDPELVEEVVAALPSEASDALTAILRNTGRFPWTRYVQQHGDIRQMGRAKRDRERPYENNPSAVEMLYYRGLVARAFMDTTDGPVEFAYIPDDLLPLIPFSSPALEEPFGRPASDKEGEFICPSNDHILDDAATMLAGLRSDHDFSRDIPEPYSQFLLELLKTAGLVEDDGKLDIDTTRLFLEKPRGDALAALCRAWIKSARLNDLRTMPAVIAEGEWQNDPLRTRQTVLDMVQSVPESTWWSLPAFIAAVKDRHPEFQRPDGDFESWFLKDSSSGDYLRGIDHWDEVEGALIRWLITGPLFWLGIVDLASWQPLKPHEAPALEWAVAFRLSGWSALLLKGIPLEGLPLEDRKIHVRSNGQINVPRLAPRAVRYLLARFCEWDAITRDEYRYRPTPSSLAAASDHGLSIDQLIHLLARHSDGIPPNVTKALKNWQTHGMAARIEIYPVLRLPSPEALNALRSSRAARFLGDSLGPAAVALKPGAELRVLAALTELGYLGEIIEKN